MRQGKLGPSRHLKDVLKDLLDALREVREREACSFGPIPSATLPPCVDGVYWVPLWVPPLRSGGIFHAEAV